MITKRGAPPPLRAPRHDFKLQRDVRVFGDASINGTQSLSVLPQRDVRVFGGGGGGGDVGQTELDASRYVCVIVGTWTGTGHQK